jgi:hypothetical protein
MIGKNSGKNQPNSLKIEVTDLKTGISISYHSMNEAAKAINIRHSSISNYFKCNSKKPIKGRYLFKKID